ncbi:MAG: MEMO1 family protein [Methanomicrobiales archaeon]
MKMRPCAVSGMFYPGDPDHLEQLLAKFFSDAGNSRNSKGVVVPHAGYIYSGRVAALSYASINPGFSGTFILVGPSHPGFETCISMVPWETPLGIVDNDTELGEALNIDPDEISHLEEHSLEVQVPFIKYRFPRARITPVMMGRQDYRSAMVLSEQITSAVKRTGRDVRIIASSDFSHYVPSDVARNNDLYAIEALNTFDIPEFYRRIGERNITVCGYGPISAMLLACQMDGGRKAELIHYATSGDITGDNSAVVGYAALAVI